MHDLERDAISTTRVEFLELVGPTGQKALAWVAATDWSTTLEIYYFGKVGNTAMGERTLAFGWPTFLEAVPRLRGSIPPVQPLVVVGPYVEGLELSVSFRQRMPAGTVRQGNIHMILGLQNTLKIGAGTFETIFTSYRYPSRDLPHEGEAWWWTGKDETVCLGWAPLLAQGTLGTTLRYIWELMGYEVLEADAFMARLSQAVQETAKAYPARARKAKEPLLSLGIELP